MIQIHFLLAFLWFLFCFSHSFFADNRVKKIITTCFSMLPGFYRLLYNCFAIVFLTGIIIFHFRVKSPLVYSQNSFSVILSMLFMSTGLAVMISCIKEYFKQHSGFYHQSDLPTLITEGMHKRVRHPLYSGTFLFVIGIAFLFPYSKNWLASAIIIFYTVVGTIFEERKLILQFGDAYRQYKRTVPKFIPKRSLVNNKNRR
jgi:protein-S-isoprenylcysteine O-methyltransferase Ste14